jgi:hypothetical protein
LLRVAPLRTATLLRRLTRTALTTTRSLLLLTLLLALVVGVFLRQPAVALFLTIHFLLVIVVEEKVAKVVEIVVAGVAVLATRRIRTCTTKFVLAVFFLLFLFAR